MKIKFEIKNRWTGKVLFEYESENNTFRETILKAIESGANLSKANLSEADLSWADLSKANLSWADLSKADLSWADLSKADLSWADLSKANLSWAYLSEADLSEAYLSEADLSEANLSEANLSEAYLSEANLSEANLSEANLSWADLSKANLSEANLSEANLSWANLSKANLSEADLSEANLSVIKADFFYVLLHAIHEIPNLKKALIDGKIDGSTYSGECACLSGTIEKSAIQNNGPEEGKRKKLIYECRNADRPAERFFLAIRPNHTPENNQAAKIVMGWIEEFETLIGLSEVVKTDS